MKYLIQTLIIILPLIIPAPSQAQENSTGSSVVTVESTFRNYCYGYIITLKNDTIYGRIKYKVPNTSALAHKVILQDSSGKETTYYPEEIMGYTIGDMEYYFTIEDEKRKSFARLIVDGEIKLLKINNINSVSYPAGGGYVGSNPTIVYFLYKTATGEITKVKQRDFYRVMSVYFIDCESVSELILKKELRYKDLETIVDRYNKCKLVTSESVFRD